MTLPNELHPGFFSAAGGGDVGDTIGQSLRFNNGPDTRVAYLQNTNITIQANSTFSGWIKLGGEPGATKGPIFGASKDSTGADNATALGWSTADEFYSRNTAGDQFWTNAKRRDYSAWYHLVLQFDSSRNMTLFVNNEQQSSTKSPINVGSEIIIGRNRVNAADEAFQGYMAALYYVDGSILAPTNFGRYNNDGVWVPQNYSGSYGSNGFHLTFDSSQANGIGHDSSGQNNHFTASGFDTTDISSSNKSNDVDFGDTPTTNWATGNSAHKTGDLAFADLGFRSQANVRTKTSGTILLPKTGIWQVEYLATTGYQTHFGFMLSNKNYDSNPDYGAGHWKIVNNGWFIDNGTQITGGVPTTSDGDVWTMIYDRENDNCKWYLNNTLEYTLNPLPSVDDDYVVNVEGYGNSNEYNFGQYAFQHTPNANAKPLNTANLPEPTIKNGKEHFDVVTYTGNGTTQSITGLEFQPDFVWLKGRNVGYHNRLFDVIRGQSSLVSDDARVEGTSANSSLTSFDSNGFSITQTTDESYNQSTKTYVAWCWKAGGTAVSNTDGTITSSVSANTEAGFSIVSYTGTGANATVGHGLTEAPEFVIVKNRESSANFWIVGTEAHGFDKILFLNTTAEAEPSSNVYFSSSPSNTVVNLGTSGNTNRLDFDFIMYAWHSVEGFSKFGSYVGNGDADGPFIYTGFAVSWLMVKRATGGTANWQIMDTTRSPSNPADKWIEANEATQEQSGNSFIKEDFLSNGFKPRGGASSQDNISGSTYVYMAFASNPFGGENVPPATAR